jgi:hypothetical protein
MNEIFCVLFRIQSDEKDIRDGKSGTKCGVGEIMQGGFLLSPCSILRLNLVCRK